MARRTSQDWINLVEKQIASGLSVTQFCQQHQLQPKYFYARKAKVLKTHNNAEFVQAKIMSGKTMKPNATSTITLTTAAGELSLPTTTSAQFMIELLNGLTS